jgi:hypothetical protein
MSEIKAATWWWARAGTVGAVAVQKRHGWKAYLAPADGYDEGADSRSVAAYGASLTETVARAMFPQFAEEPYDP